MELLYEEKIKGNKQGFKKKLLEIASQLEFNPNWLMAVFKKESNVNPQARNTKYLVNGKPATGLLQWVENTAQEKHQLSVDDIYQLDGIAQLDLVYAYFKPVAHRITKYSDLYRYVFFPVSLGKDSDYVFQTRSLSAERVAQQNPVIDLNKDHQITNTEFEEYALAGIKEPFKTQFRSQAKDSATKFAKRNRSQIVIGAIVLLLSLYLFYTFFI